MARVDGKDGLSESDRGSSGQHARTRWTRRWVSRVLTGISWPSSAITVNASISDFVSWPSLFPPWYHPAQWAQAGSARSALARRNTSVAVILQAVNQTRPVCTIPHP